MNLLQKLFSGLTQEGITLPNGQFENASQAENSIPELPQSVVTGGLDAPAAAPAAQSEGPVKLPFLQAMRSGPGGTPNVASPALSTKGKILTSLLSAAAGGLSAAGSRTVGEGFAHGMELPFIQAQQRQQAQRGQIENQVAEQQLQYAPLLRALGIMKSQADIGKTQAETSAIPVKTALEQAQTEAAFYKDDPTLGLIDLRTRQPISNAAAAPLTAEEAAVLGKQEGERVPLKLKNTASEIVNRGKTTVNTEEGVFDYNRNTGQKTKLGNNPRMVFAPENRFVPAAADPNNPGDLTYMRVGDAAKQGAKAPQSASVTTEKAILKSEVPTKAGDQKVAFNTAIQHADLLRQASKALANGDNQTLAGLKNKFKNEFGYSGPVDAQAIADAYGREVTKMLSGGHLTDSEISSVGKTINPLKQNYATLDSVLSSYQALAKSKLGQLNQQEQNVTNRSQGKSGAAEIHYEIVNGQLVAQ